MLFLDNDNKILKDVLEGRVGEKCVLLLRCVCSRCARARLSLSHTQILTFALGSHTELLARCRRSRSVCATLTVRTLTQPVQSLHIRRSY